MLSKLAVATVTAGVRGHYLDTAVVLKCVCVCVCTVRSRVQLFAFHGLWLTTPLSVGFFRQEYWGGLPLPFPGELPDPGSEP